MMADAMCRYQRLAGDRVWFLTGTDEHGDKIAQVAAKEGISPRAFADRIAALYKEEWRRLGITNDDFIRTTEPRHEKVVQQILQDLWDRGEIYLGEYSGQYCYGCERFYTEKEIVDGKCPDHQTPLTFIKENNYLFRMSKYQARLVKHLEDNPGLHPAGPVPQRGAGLPARAAPGPLDQPAAGAARVGHSLALRREPRHLCLVRRPHQLRLRARLSGRRKVQDLLATGHPPHRQGHRQGARDLLAHHALGGEPAALPWAAGPRLLVGRGAEDVQVPRQCRGGLDAGREVRPRGHPLLRPA